jgi:bacteriophage N4 adsorption protein B
MSAVDYFSLYLYGLTYVIIVIAVFVTISGLDDVFIDVVYWFRRAWRAVTVYRRHARTGYEVLLSVPEKPLAVMIPAWHETGVIGKMAQNAANTLDYENYHIFVGTYPNDPQTQQDVDEVCALFPNVHKVVCARPGPTSKADCLNNVLDAIRQFEKNANLNFAGFVLHDAEDVISALELRLFNFLVDRKDLIQVPVYPFERKWYEFVGMHYIDEFTELHAKDVPVREALAGQVPSAGVGTCFSRRAIDTLLVEGDGIAFDTQSLTEDYDIGFRLKARGLKEVFVRFPVLDQDKAQWRSKRAFGQSFNESNVICVREFFPDTIAAAVRQKSRWIIGIVFQGYVTHHWTKDWVLNYFLWRDRKGVLTNFFSFAANIIFLQVVLIWLYEIFWPDAYQFLSIFAESDVLVFLLWFNIFLMINRLAQRMIFVTNYYGLFQGLLSLPRMILGNFINFMANWRALRQVMAQGNPRRVAWEKTTHDFPTLGEVSRARRMIGQILVEQGVLEESVLLQRLLDKPSGMKIGTWLVHSDTISAFELAQGLAEQAGVKCQQIVADELSPELIAKVPAAVALHYAVLPIAIAGDKLTLASESILSPIALAALRRKLGLAIDYSIVPIGQVTVGLRHWYARLRQTDPREVLAQAISDGQLDAALEQQAWQRYESHQILLGEVLQSLGRIDTAAFSAILLQHEQTEEPLGQFLVSQSILSPEILDLAIARQKEIQLSMSQVIDQLRDVPPSPKPLVAP